MTTVSPGTRDAARALAILWITASDYADTEAFASWREAFALFVDALGGDVDGATQLVGVALLEEMAGAPMPVRAQVH